MECSFCSHCQSGNVMKNKEGIFRYCKPKGKRVSLDSTFCDKFLTAPFFWCDEFHHQTNFVVCVNRQRNPKNLNKYKYCESCYRGEQVAMLLQGKWGCAKQPQTLVKRSGQKLVVRKRKLVKRCQK